MKAAVDDYTIIVALHPRISKQAESETISKNSNFVLNKLGSSEAIKVIASYEEYKGIITSKKLSGDSSLGLSNDGIYWRGFGISVILFKDIEIYTDRS